MTSNTAGGRQVAPDDPATTTAVRLTGHLGTGGLMLTALALNAPLASMAGFVPVEIGLGLGAASPLVYLSVMCLVLVFALGVLAMASHMHKPGAFYTYVTAGLGRSAGLGAGLVALAGYLLLGACSYVLTGLLAEQLSLKFHGPDAPWWTWALLMWLIVSGLSLFNIDVSTKVLGVALVIEVIIVLLWDLRVMLNGGPEGRGLDVTAHVESGSIGAAALFALACLTGFESLQVFRAETRDPDRTLPRASYLTVGFLGGFYALSSWAYLVAFGADGAVATVAAPSESFLGSLEQYAGHAVADLANVILISSGIAAILAVQNIAARYVYALGRDRVFPAWVGQPHPRHHAPTRAATVVALIVLALAAVIPALDLDPVTAYVAMAGVALWGLIFLMFLTSAAIIAFFAARPGAEPSIGKRLLAPGLATIGFGYVVFEATRNRSVLIGGNESLATWSLVAITLVGIAAALYAVWLRSAHRDVWLRIGNQDD